MKKRGIAYLGVAIAIGMGMVFAGPCDRDIKAATAIESGEVRGTLRFKDGTPVPAQSVQYRLSIGGEGLFSEGINGCRKSDPHMQGALQLNVSSGASGEYVLSPSFDEARSVTDPACRTAGIGGDQLESLRLDASLLADEANCRLFCVAQGGPTESCVADCSSGQRILIASRDLPVGQAPNWSGVDLMFDRLGPSISEGLGPDLRVDGEAAARTAQISVESFAPDSCALQEQCIRGPGQRKLLRFEGTIQNLGSAPLVLGDPADNPLFELSACHGHYHLHDMMTYELLDSAGNPVILEGQAVVGHKQGFCMMDIEQINRSASDVPVYDCENQGISAGWADSYDESLDCQWVDITDVPPGDYQLRLTVNPEGIFSESDPANNAATVPVRVD